VKHKRLPLFVVMVLMLGVFAYSQMQEMITVPELPYRADIDWFKLPTGTYFGDVPGVAMNSKGHVLVASRSNTDGPAFAPRAAQLMEFDANGNWVREIGQGMYSMAYLHAVDVDRYDNIWVTDKVTNVVTKFHPDGRFAMVFGKRAESGDPPGQGPVNHLIGGGFIYQGPRPNTLAGPSNVAFDSKDNIYVGEGYGNNRVAVWDKNGRWVRSFGVKGTGTYEFSNLHGIAIDSQDRMWIADRFNKRIMVYDAKTVDANGNYPFIREIKLNNIHYPRDLWPFDGGPPPRYGSTDGGAPGGVSSPWTFCMTPTSVYVGDGFPARIYKLTYDGKVLGTYGKAGRLPGEFSWVHQIACRTDDLIYAADENAYRVQRLTLKK
jgi:hypothetical protein